MNSKPTLLVTENKTVFQQYFFEEVWEQYFNIEIIDLEKNYDKQSTVVVSDWTDLVWGDNTNERKLADNGIRHVIDHCPDSWHDGLDDAADFILRPQDYYRFREPIAYKAEGLEYDKIKLTRNPTKDFLMLMNLKRKHRDQIYNALESFLTQNVYSYVEAGIPLQNALDIVQNETTWQRYIDPQWYSDTRFTIAVETFVNPNDRPKILFETLKQPVNPNTINVTEKVCKPLAFKHPLIVWGEPWTLQWLKRQGFETFDHCIDESYDLEQDTDKRFSKMIEQVHLCIKDKTIFEDKLSQEKIEYNYNHFYNESSYMKVMHEQLIDPLLEFINA